jgi:hypothetical protein
MGTPSGSCAVKATVLPSFQTDTGFIPFHGDANPTGIESILRTGRAEIGWYGPGPDTGLYSAALMVIGGSALELYWLSEPMFLTPGAALDHAEDVIGPEIFSVMSGFDGAVWI